MTISEPDDRSAQQEIAKAAQTVDIFSASPVVQLDAPMMLPSAIVDEHEDDHLQSNWDDHDGYYKTVVGELLDNRYRVLGAVGRGVFSTVLKCIDTNPDSRGPFGETPVAIKMIRNNDTMRKAAQKEIQLLNEIKMRDEDKMKHCVRLLHTFEHRNHTALTFEAMQMNLREVLKKFGKDVGITVSSVQVYSRQLFFALKHLADLNIVHADIKPDNILVSDDLKSVKLCDFGSAFKETDIDNDPTPYLVSRFYRAPEIILGLAYDRMVDLWSVATCLYELFTGHVMFPGSTNNHMLKLMMDVKGR
jgi:serine/threonine-protein kinase PRP4